MFESFEEALINVVETTIFTRRKGNSVGARDDHSFGQRLRSGPPLLLLHGFPETHLMWHAIAPRLADTFTVICADLRGYGASGKPASTPDHAPYAKSPMAYDMVRVMERLGFSRFGVAGHDRGGRVAYRMALDYPESVDRLAVLDIIPIGEAFGRADMRLALGYWPWSVLSHVDNALQGWGSDQSSFPPEVRAAYIATLQDPATVHAVCEEYRAAATLDFTQDIEDRHANHRIACPVPQGCDPSEGPGRLERGRQPVGHAHRSAGNPEITGDERSPAAVARSRNPGRGAPQEGNDQLRGGSALGQAAA